MLDGRCRTRARPDVVRRAPARARRPRATAADPRWRLFHRRRARRHAHRSASAGPGRPDRAAVDGDPGRQSAGARALRRDRGGAARRIGSRACHRRRSGSRRPQRDAARLQRAPARASRFCRYIADGGRYKLVCLRNNRRKGLFNGGLWVVKERPKARRQIIRMRLKPDEELGDRMIKVSVRPECFTGAIEEFDWPARKPYDEFDFGYVLTVHKAQGSQWDDVVLFDEFGAFLDNRDRWLYTGVTRAAKRLSVVV